MAIVSTLLFYDIDFQYVLDKSMRCTSSKRISSVTQQIRNYLLVTLEETIDSSMADLFGPILNIQLCLICLKNDLHPTSVSILNCPKHLFLGFDPLMTENRKRPKLTPHVNFQQILSNNILFHIHVIHYNHLWCSMVQIIMDIC